MQGVRGTFGSVVWQAQPPEIRVRVRVYEGRLFDTIMVAEHAIRDAAWFLFGKRTGPGYPVRLEPAKELTADVFQEGSLGGIVPGITIQAVETRCTLVPRGASPEAVAKNLGIAAKRAMHVLEKRGVGLVQDIAAPLPSPIA